MDRHVEILSGIESIGKAGNAGWMTVDEETAGHIIWGRSTLRPLAIFLALLRI